MTLFVLPERHASLCAAACRLSLLFVARKGQEKGNVSERAFNPARVRKDAERLAALPID